MTMTDNEYATRRASGVLYYAEAVDRHLKLAEDYTSEAFEKFGAPSLMARYHLDAAAVNATMVQAAATLLQSDMGIVRPVDTT